MGHKEVCDCTFVKKAKVLIVGDFTRSTRPEDLRRILFLIDVFLG